jgi:hypothetical protein
MIRPDGEGNPVAYACGANLKSGVRIVAAYGNASEHSIWLFSVPADIFSASQASATVIRSSWFRSSPKQPSSTEWMSWWLEDERIQEWLTHAAHPTPGVVPAGSIWPVKIRGQQIAVVSEGIADLAIDSSPHVMTVWGFSKGGFAKSWKFGAASPSKLTLLLSTAA